MLQRIRLYWNDHRHSITHFLFEKPMNDLDILKQIHEELKQVDHPPFDPSLIELYGKLVDRFPEEGLELLLADKDLSEVEEMALRLLNRWEYIAFDLKHHAGDGYYYHVNLRGKRFLELANKSVAVGMIQDSGKRETFETGAVRDTAEGKCRPDLISPFAIERLAEWLRLGAEKYTPRNWEKGLSVSRTIASLCRHLMKFQQGYSDEDHIAGIMCNAMFIAHTQEMIKRGVLPESLLDMPKYESARRCDVIPSTHFNGDEPLDT